jgi:SAM-dependent methyltransferase
MHCRNCKKNKFIKIITIGKQPISSVFLEKKFFKLKKYSLDLLQCSSCKLIQFGKIPPLNDMYGLSYGYRTSLSNLMINHMKKKFSFLIAKNFIKKESNILDIGSNDGTFLNFFADHDNRNILYGVDPSAEKFKKYYHSKINLIVDYFSKEILLSKLNNNKNKKFSIITSFAMFYDLEDPNKFCSDINYLLNSDGIWISEFSYFPLLLKNLTYDQICHEHVAYYDLSSFKKIIDKNGLRLLDISFNEINGGSIEVICCKKNSKLKSNKEKISKVLQDEKRIDFDSYKKFSARIDNVKKVLNIFLDNVNNSGKTVYGYGASTKGNIVLNHCNIDYKKIKYICDENEFKFGKYTPGSNIQIVSKNYMRKKRPDYLLVLIWSFRSEVIKQEKSYLLKGGKLVFHLPIFHIVDKHNYKSFLNSSFDTFSYSI